MNGLQLPPIVAATFARQDAAEREQDRRAEIDRAIERQDRREAALAEEARFELHHGYTRQELFAHMSGVADAKEGRDPGAEYGSAKRAAVMIDGQVLRAREMTPERRGRARLTGCSPRAKAGGHAVHALTRWSSGYLREIAAARRMAYREIIR